MMDQFPEWVKWVFSGIGVLLLSALFWLIKKNIV